jgi:hypothetical protein
MTHPLDAALALEPLGEGRFAGRTSADYWNMVGPYGGITAAICQRAILDDPRHLGQPLALTVNYCAPVRDGPFVVELSFAQTGRTTQHVVLRMIQGARTGTGTEPGSEAATATAAGTARAARHEHTANAGDVTVVQAMAVMGVRRPLWSRVHTPRPEAPSPATLARRAPRPGIRWLERFDSRYVRPMMTPPAPGEATLDWVRDDPPRSLDYPALASLADSFFPSIYALVGKRVPIATVSMNVYYHAGAETVAAVGDDYLLGASRSQVFESGFFDCESQLWHGERLLATTQQLVWYRD